MVLSKAVFLDRDGVINQTILRDGAQRAPQDFSDFVFVEDVHATLCTLHERGYVLLVCTNQPDVARGWQTRAQVDAFHAHICAQLPVARVYACFHDNSDACECRKPKPGLLLQGSREHAVDMTQSFMVGDRAGDIEAGRAAGCRTVYVRHPHDHAPDPAADFNITRLAELTNIIL